MSKCNSCGAEIKWRENANNRWEPLNMNGVSHFETCPQAKEWRARKIRKEKADHVEKLEGLKDKQTRL